MAPTKSKRIARAMVDSLHEWHGGGAAEDADQVMFAALAGLAAFLMQVTAAIGGDVKDVPKRLTAMLEDALELGHQVNEAIGQDH